MTNVAFGAINMAIAPAPPVGLAGPLAYTAGGIRERSTYVHAHDDCQSAVPGFALHPINGVE